MRSQLRTRVAVGRADQDVGRRNAELLADLRPCGLCHARRHVDRIASHQHDALLSVVEHHRFREEGVMDTLCYPGIVVSGHVLVERWSDHTCAHADLEFHHHLAYRPLRSCRFRNPPSCRFPFREKPALRMQLPGHLRRRTNQDLHYRGVFPWICRRNSRA